jgi:hypothetical protein
MLLTFLNHQWTGFWRSRNKGGTIAAQVIMGFLFLYLTGVAILVGYSMEGLIEKFLPGKDVILVFNGMILYYFAIDFLARLQLQELPTLSVVPYLHLNIPKRKLVSFLNVRAAFTAFNIIPLFIFFPFCILNISESYGPLVCMMYLLSVFSLMVFNNYAALYFKRISAENLKAVLAGLIFLITIALLEYFGIFSIASLSDRVFEYISIQPAAGLVFVCFAGLMFFINDRYLKGNLYIEELRSGAQKRSATDYPFLDRFGEAGALVALEIKLILRNKRPRATVLKGLIFIFYGLIFYKQKMLENNDFTMMLFAAVFMTGNVTILYGQFMFGWQSAEFDGLLVSKTSIKSFIKAKFLLLTMASTAITLIISLYGFISWKILLIQFAAYLFSIGVSPVIVLYFATKNYKYVDLSKGASFNWQGVGATSLLMSLPLLLSPFVIYTPIALWSNSYWALGGIALTGIAGCLTRGFWTGFLAAEFDKRKYKIASGFRERS